MGISCLCRSLVLNRLRPVASGGGKAQPGSPRWRSKGYRCIGGVLYKVSANKLSKTSSQPGDAGSRPLVRTERQGSRRRLEGARRPSSAIPWEGPWSGYRLSWPSGP
ncbi:Zinc finger CCCH domain-containing protein 3 [Saguinus oedipus]|uniref:Zinc finger CCCH domain-containing protein 3 n=1 Tax=Saguinus oedipus TaxID=9490 RepID=A0ABQ9UDR9_SAGOE|nr:Zinc finger CCCH domain-containing protein 3 [Saguinus oedipus]